jgi:hypothetical protein
MRNTASSTVQKKFLIFNYGMNWITVTKTVHINHICIFCKLKSKRHRERKRRAEMWIRNVPNFRTGSHCNVIRVFEHVVVAESSYTGQAKPLPLPHLPCRNWTPFLAACAISLQVATSWFTQQRVRNKFYVRIYPRGVQNAQYSTSDCGAIHKTGWIATLEGNHCITIFVMNQAEDRWRMVTVGLRK